ncbi:metallophosphoesterase [Heliomicrobium modesticaldum Ice1]|uniref:Metallophosphoesterase n=1 Tax=Heliobacterium modesticaldum (strain ATCC 51547 / Ice1) TaxID=498761 RepID=B0TF41_HELMI|nr:metallophosphoesterase [Heliomicrobium modesticaldum]ABZ83024.1 metallophosphoesterase [Heliomicrobium modesticaldum Ice1]
MHPSPLFSIMRLLPIAFFLLINYLSYMALVRWMPFFRPGRWRVAFVIIAFLSALPPLYSVATGFQTQEAWLRIAYYPAFAWNIGQLIFLLAVPLVFIFKRLQSSPEAEAQQESQSHVHLPEKVTRRQLLQGAITAVPFFALTVAADGVLIGDNRVVTRTYPVTIPGLSPHLDGLRLVQISDVHLGTFFPLDRLDDALELVEKQKPDILTITGDYVDDVTLLHEAIRRTEQVSATLGSYYCLGNHEHYRDLDKVRGAFRSSSIRHLDNSCSTVENSLCLLGIDYPFTGRGEDNRAAVTERMLDKALSGAPAEVPKILLTHHPDGFNAARKRGVALSLAGHTHGGQVGIGDRSLFPFAMAYMRGWYGDDEHKLFVHSGLGHWMPFRLGCPSEIVTFVLRSA